MQGAGDLMEMAALLRRMILFHHEYYYELIGVFPQIKQGKNVSVLGQSDRKYLDN